MPTHELVYRKIRQMILFGELLPGQNVTILGLVNELSVGVTPVREAIRRLTAEGALDFQGNRRICVPEISLSQLEELSFAREKIEPHIAFLSTKAMNTNDIDVLETLDSSLNAAIEQGNVGAYLELNYRFHETLYRHSDAQILLSISSALWLRVGPSLRVVCGRIGTANLPDMHDEALSGLRAQNPRAVQDAIREDIRQGHQAIRSAIQENISRE